MILNNLLPVSLNELLSALALEGIQGNHPVRQSGERGMPIALREPETTS